MNILIDIGHGKDTFKTKGEKGIKGVIEEYTLNVNAALIFKKILEKNNHKVDFVIPPNSNDVGLTNRSNLIDNYKPDIVYSLHHDYSSNETHNGTSFYYYFQNKNTNSLSNIMAENLRLSKYKVHGVWDVSPDYHFPGNWRNYTIINKPKTSVILIEIGFFSNKKDRERSLNTNELNKFFNALITNIYTCKEIPITFNELIDLNDKLTHKKEWKELYAFAIKNNYKIAKYLPQLIEKFGGEI